MAQDVTAAAPPTRPGQEVPPMGRSQEVRGGGHVLVASLGQYAGFLPALMLYGVFFAAPLGLIVAYSFWKVVDYNVVHDWTLDNYHYFFSVSTYVSTF